MSQYQPPQGAPPPHGPPPQQPGHGQAIASMVLGILGLVVPYAGIVLAIVGLVLAISAKKKGNRSGMATAGMVCSIIGLAGSIIITISCIACIACTAATTPGWADLF